jgi:outer membrane protein TolC
MKRINIVLLMVLSVLSAETLNVQEAVRRALEVYPAVQAAQMKVSAAQAQEAYAYSVLWPSIALNGSYGNGYQSKYMYVDGDWGSLLQVSQMPDAEVAKTTQAGYSVDMPVFNMGVFQGAAITGIAKEAAVSDEKKARLDTIFAVKQAYYQVLLARKTVRVFDQEYKALHDDYNMISARYKSGLVQQTDVLRSEIQLRNLDQDIANARKNVIIAEQNFSAYVPSLNIAETALQLEVIPTMAIVVAYDELRERMYAHRPDWQSFQMSKRIALENIHLAQSNFYPSFTLHGSNVWNRLAMPDLSYEQKNWNVALIGNWVVFNGLGNLDTLEMKSKDYASVLQNEAVLTRNYDIELRDAYLSLQQAYIQLRSAGTVVQLARDNYSQIRARYTTGMDTSLNYIDALNTLLSGELSLAGAEVNVLLSHARLEKIVGTAIARN